MSIIHVVSVSGGKDSAATLLLAIERFGAHRVRGIFCDTGNEHDLTYDYVRYLERATGIKIDWLKANFDAEIAQKRHFIARDQRTRRVYRTVPVFDSAGQPVLKRDGRGQIVQDKKGKPIQKERKVGGGHKVRWSNKAKRRALAVLYPTGNPFLDLCMWKGRFPSRRAQFCTEQLKRDPAVLYQIELVDAGHAVVSCQGVRRDESLNRRDAKKFDVIGPSMYAYRPLVEWTAADVFAYCASMGIDPNALYKQGMSRVGCMPCINVAKEELAAIAMRFVEHIGRIFTWEQLVSACSKRGFSTFLNKEQFQIGDTVNVIFEKDNIWKAVEWSKTSRGGRQFSLLTALDEPAACASSYGLCG